MAAERMLECDHRPAVLRGQVILVGRHRGAVRFVWLDRSPFAHTPEPVRGRHLGDHSSIAEGRGLHDQSAGGWPVATTLPAVADRALGFIDRLATREDGPIGPDLRRRDLSSVARWDARVDVPSPASLLVFVAGLLVLAVRERPRSESPGAHGDDRQRQQADVQQRSTNHLFLHPRNAQRRAEADARRRLKEAAERAAKSAARREARTAAANGRKAEWRRRGGRPNDRQWGARRAAPLRRWGAPPTTPVTQGPRPRL